ncbi:MAG: MazG nucleotide pyrophosphohydrolase domain-containing protein [Microgenomates group bacterium]
MKIKEAQKKVYQHLLDIGYFEIEKTSFEAFTHLIEEVGEVARILLCKKTKRGKMQLTTTPGELEEEIADIFWQTLKLCLYLNIDLESAFKKKYKKNIAKKIGNDL